MIFVVKADGTSYALEKLTKGAPADTPLDHMQKIVGGYVEHVGFRWLDGTLAQMWIDEDGKQKRKPLNYVATGLYLGHMRGMGVPVEQMRDVIVGDALILTGEDMAE